MTARTDAGQAVAPTTGGLRMLLAPLAWGLLGALLIALLTQIPARHLVDVGGYDAAYVQGFYDSERSDDPGGPRPYLSGSDGAARWTRDSAALLFPQVGLPGELRLRLRGWRPAGVEQPRVTVLLNGNAELGSFSAGDVWEEYRFTINSGLLKASDFFVEIRADPVTLPDGRAVGVLIDQVEYRSSVPALPYPAQLIYGFLVGGMLYLLGRRRAQGWAQRAAPLLMYGLVWLLFYHLQPPLYPYPLRMLPPLVCLGLAALLTLLYGPDLAARVPALVRVVAPLGLIVAWTGAILLLAHDHLTLSRPGVENDFRVFATRETLAQIFSADGFYNLGYPLLLWLARPFVAGNAFLAGRIVAALCGAVLLAGGYWLARALLPPGPALLALITLALSGMVSQYGLYLGSDMPFAACVTLSVAALAWASTHQWRAAYLALAGLFGGMAFLMRHLGIVLLPWGLLVCVGAAWPRGGSGWSVAGRRAAAFLIAFLLAAAPQLIVNTIQSGSPLYNQQAKNIWLAVYGGSDWGRWDEAPNTIGLADVVLRDPGRFLDNWWRNIIGYTGSGAEDTSEFGRANQLRLLGWPANWLALAGLLGWVTIKNREPRTENRESGQETRDKRQESRATVLALILLIGLYVAAVSTAFTLQRFFLPLVPIYALAAGWSIWWLISHIPSFTEQYPYVVSFLRRSRQNETTKTSLEQEMAPPRPYGLGVGMLLVVVLWGGSMAGARYVLANQPADEVAAVRMVEAYAPADAPIAARVAARLPLAKYSPIAHRVVEWPAGADPAHTVTAAELAGLYDAGARLLLWDETGGPPPLPDPDAARLAISGRYGLYSLK